MTKKLISKLVTLTLFIIGFNIGTWLYHEIPIMRQSYIDYGNKLYKTLEEYEKELNNNINYQDI